MERPGGQQGGARAGMGARTRDRDPRGRCSMRGNKRHPGSLRREQYVRGHFHLPEVLKQLLKDVQKHGIVIADTSV